MNEDKIKGQWKQLTGKLKAKWGKLTDDDLQVAEGNRDYLAGKIQERYGIARDEADTQFQDVHRERSRPRRLPPPRRAPRRGHEEDHDMGKYLIAWLLGVPIGLLVLFFLVTHLF